MKKLNKVAMLFASAALAAPMAASAAAHGGMAPNAIDNWRNGTGELVWMNGTGEYCWRDGFWTPATAAKNIDGKGLRWRAPAAASASAAASAATPAPAGSPAAAAAPTAAPAAPAGGREGDVCG
jgi:OOP family OmpA-OmpF porin